MNTTVTTVPGAAALPDQDRAGVLIVSPIAVARGEGGWHTLDLWAHDVNAQAARILVTLVCPIIAVVEGSIDRLALQVAVLGLDALCRDALPVCPDAAAYAALGLDPRLLYRQGDAQALAQCVRGLEDPDVRDALRALSAALLQRHTLDAMHTDRLAWMQASAARISTVPASP